MSFFNNNNNTTSGGFGGFGSSTNNTAGGFGATSSGGGLFGSNTATAGGFGGGGGGFGATNTNSPFGANKTTGFGAPATTTAGGMFGGNTTTSGGFGATNSGGFGANNNATGGFGGNTGGSLFGTNKPATTGFGASNTGGSIFGSNNNATTGGGFGNTANTGSSLFGANNNNNATTGGFGSTSNANAGFGGFGAPANANANNNNNNNNGTAGTPFQAFTEKDAAASQTSHYQSITFQQPYLGKSFEELRTEDYLQGRKFGNSNGQAGSFGTSTGFGGSVFGANNNATNTSNTGSLFGNNAAANTANNNNNNTFGGFGNTANNTSSGFGNNNTSGGIFGNQNKPATGGVFGNTAASGTTTNAFGGASNTGGSLFGGGGGFGANNNATTANTGGSLFGNNNNNNNNQNKPTFGGFGATNTTSGFPSTNTNTGGSLFGNGANNANNTGGLFGSNNNQQQQQPTNTFGAATNTTGGLFGNQNKPATSNLFGNSTNTNTGGGIFGSTTNNAQPTNNLFGGTNTNTGGGLFGNNQQQKPAGTGLFGNNTANANTGGSLFGNTNNQQPGGGLFGNTANNTTSLFGNNQNKPATGGLFGNNTNTTNTGGGLSLFGNNNQQAQPNAGGSLFGNMNQNNQSQPANNSNNLSLFGSLQQSTNQPVQNQLHASLTNAPYGNEQLFTSLGAASPHIGPLATPLSGAKPPPPKAMSLMASTRLNSPVYTPRNGSIGRNGYGLSYSTYGTPGSAYSVSLTPGASSLLKPTGSIGSGLASRLMKSMSMNSLRGDGTPNSESLLRPTPGSSSSRYVNTGSMRRLHIDRSLRTDLFAPPENKQLDSVKDNDRGLKKQVSFDNSTHTSNAEPSASNALVRTGDDSQEDNSSGLIKAGPVSYPNLVSTPEMEQTNGSSLTAVPEDSQQNILSSNKRLSSSAMQDAEPGEYWTKPALKDLKQMSRAQLSKMSGFTVGRENVGRIEFGPCDLTNVPLDDICDNIVKLVTRTATVYTDDANKPAVGKGLNVPSTIYLERSWPRSNGGKKAVSAKQGKEYDKHIARLKRVHDTHFKNYDPDTGVWCFTVDHYTTYGLDDDDDDMTEDLLQDPSVPSDPPATPSQQESDTMHDIDINDEPVEDDTFQFKLDQRSQSGVQASMQFPGSIEGISYDYDDPSADESMVEDDLRMSGGLGGVELEDPFILAGGAVQAPSPNAVERFQSSMVLADGTDEFEIAEQVQTEPEPELPGSFNAENPKLLRSILKPSRTARSIMSPEKLAATSWEDQLQQTISPKKRDRQALRNMQQTAFKSPEEDLGESLFKRSMLGYSALGQSYLAQKSAKKASFMPVQNDDFGKSQAFRTSMDIMNSLWSQEKPGRKITGIAKGFENPYPKKPRLSASSELDEQEAAFHDSFKPSFTNNGTIVYAVLGATKQVSGELVPTLKPIVGEHEEVRFAKWTHAADPNANVTKLHQQLTVVQAGEFPQAVTSDDWNFVDIAEAVTDKSAYEFSIWKLASILWDPIEVVCNRWTEGMTDQQVESFRYRLRKDAFADFCAKHVSAVVNEQVRQSRSAEQKALFYLTRNDVKAACDVLMQAKDFRLATMVAQLPGSEASRRAMKNQIEAWRERNDWSEMSEAVRAIYSILAGQTCVVKGKHGPAENRVADFCIAERFGFSWMQSFGLRVFFGGHDGLETSAVAYVEDLTSGRETVTPSPWWSTEVGNEREDTLMTLLRQFANPANVDLADLFDAKTISGSQVNSRTAWQLATLFKAKDAVLAPQQMDLLTLNYASELESANKFTTSAWVLLHLSSPIQREHALKALLERNAAKIPEPNNTSSSSSSSSSSSAEDSPKGIFEYLTQSLLLPPSMCWAAKALHARARLHDPGLQTLYLLHGDRVAEAHEVLRTTVGPAAVIEEELEDLLLNVLAQFPRDRRPEGWNEAGGGGVFEAYARLSRMSPGKRETGEGRKVMAELALGLKGMMTTTTKGGMRGGMSLEQKVAGIEMGRGLMAWAREMGEEGEVRDQFGGEFDEGGAGKGMGGTGFEAYRSAMMSVGA